ncbi:MAG: DUF1416 domain-containing protein [Actinomycetota bacterium]
MTVLKGRVVQGGSPVEGAYVRLIGPAGEFVNEQRTLEEGTFIFHLAPGAWTLDWTAPGRAGAQQTVELTAGQIADLDLEIS